MREENLLLAIDVGNTHTVIGYFEEKQLKHTWRVSTHPICTSDEFRLKIELLLHSDGLSLKTLEAIVVSSVVPSFTRMLQSAFQNDPLSIIQSSWPFSFDIVASPAHQVGMDRLVNAETVIREYGAPSIVVDSGTATTICAISKDENGRAQYLGGAIIPGIELSMEALAKNTALLFTIDLTPPEFAIGNNTRDALRSGLMLGYASLIDGMVNRFKKELGSSQIPVIATGGISQLMKNLTQELNYFDSNLTLKGIAYLYESIRKR
jgi:type III pantothenate kinase